MRDKRKTHDPSHERCLQRRRQGRDCTNAKGAGPTCGSSTRTACQGKQRAILLGASNSWFPVMLSALSIPSTTDKLGQFIESNWAELEECENAREVKLKRKLLKGLAMFTEEQIWEAVAEEEGRDE